MLINWADIHGTEFSTNAVPLVALVQREPARRSDKTWRRHSEWHLNFPMFCGAQLHEYVVEKGTETWEEVMAPVHKMFDTGKGVYGKDPGYLETFPAVRVADEVLFGFVVARTLTALNPLERHGYVNELEVITTPSGVRCAATGHYTATFPRFRVTSGDGGVLFSSPLTRYEGDSAWKFIHEISGQSVRRRARIELANAIGSAAAYAVMAHFGAGIPCAVEEGRLLALLESEFRPSRRGDGYVVADRGKVIISRTDKSGYYRVARETDRVRFVELEEEFKIVDPVQAVAPACGKERPLEILSKSSPRPKMSL